jgi:hypothetical protein
MFDYDTLFQKLKTQLGLCKTGELSSTRQVQKCFAVAYRCLWQLEDRYTNASTDKSEEIFYLKQVRPLFVREVHYYELLYFIELFVPEEKSEALQFWKRECLRLEKFQK